MARFGTVVVLVAVLIAGGWASPAEEKLIQALLADYESNSRPVIHVADTLMTNFSFDPIKLDALDVDENEMMLHGWMKMSWKDVQLSWNASEHDGITVLNLPIESIWKPDIKLYNSPESTVDNTLAIIMSDGTVLWVPPITCQVTCKLNAIWYPFDIQKCSLIFGSWTYDKTKIDLQVAKLANDDDVFSSNKEWRLLSTTHARKEKKYICCENPYPSIEVTLTLRRRACRKVIEHVLPMATIVMLGFMTMMIPATRADVRLLVVTLLLGSSLLHLRAMDSMVPKSFSLLSLLNGQFVFILVCLFLCNCIYLAFHRGHMDCSFLSKLSGLVGASTASPEKTAESALIMNEQQRHQRTLDSVFTLPLATIAVLSTTFFLAVPLLF